MDPEQRVDLREVKWHRDNSSPDQSRECIRASPSLFRGQETVLEG